MPPKKNAKGKRRGDSDSDDDLAVKMKEVKIDAAAAPVATGKAAKKDKKKGGGGGGKGRNDSDDEDPLAIMKKLAAEADSDDDVSVAVKPPPAPAAKPNNKKDKKKGGKKGADSDDEDPLEMMKRLAGADDDEEEEEVPTPVPTSRKPSPASVIKTPEPAPIQLEEDEDEEEDGNGDPSKASHGKMSKAERKKQKSAQKNKSATMVVTPDVPEKEPVAVVPPSPVVAATSSPILNQSAPASAPVAVAVAVQSTVTAPTAPVKEAPKTKLQLKLEKAKAEKLAADEARKLADAAQAAENKAAEKAADAARKAQAAQEAIEKAATAANAIDDSSDKEPEEAPTPAASTKRKGSEQDQLTEEEKEARLKATMYGDDVFDEYAKPNQEALEAQEQLDSGKKLSRKELRKKQQEAEAKEREIEYNKAMMKASAEGAQFAVSQSIIDPNDPHWMNSLDVVIPSISISAHNKELFVNTELIIAQGRRYGLVGPNGAGKSTLLKMIAAGELKIPPRIDYLYVEQEVVADETPAVDAVLRADKVRWALVEEEKALLKELENGPNEKADTRLGEVYEQLANIGASSAEARARRILFGLGFDAEMQVRPTKYFSGGWRMRISLARALFIEPTLLMLDEPTNHLDLNAVIWLDDYLQKWKKTLLIVSHDQDFLNSVCQEILHLDEKKLFTYKGNYDTFKDLEAMKRKAQQKAWEKQEKRLRELKSKGVTKQNAEKKAIEEKSKKREPGARSKKQEAAAVSSGGLESGENQVELIKRPREYEVAFEFPEVVHLSPPILEVRDVNFRYGPSLPWLFKGCNFGLDMESRVCIVGPNGSGKSTILKIITGDLNPPEGEVRRNPRLRVGVYNQHFVDRLPMEEDPVTYLRRLFSEETYQSCRNILGRYGLEGHAHTIPIRDLSGGQKARVVFVELSLMAPHLLFLDEPTNNLDIESIDALCDALKLFNGGVVLVSHDARLIETTNCQLWVVEDQNVTPWVTGFQGYRDHLLKKLEEQLNAIMPGAGERPK